MFEVIPGESGFTARELWHNTNLKNKFTSSVLFEGNIYGLDDDVLTCIDALNGSRKWREGRYGFGQVLRCCDHLVVLSAKGELVLVKATPMKFEELARFQAITGKTWNHPAIADGKIFVRNALEMACYSLEPADR